MENNIAGLDDIFNSHHSIACNKHTGIGRLSSSLRVEESCIKDNILIHNVKHDCLELHISRALVVGLLGCRKLGDALLILCKRAWCLLAFVFGVHICNLGLKVIRNLELCTGLG